MGLSLKGLIGGAAGFLLGGPAGAAIGFSMGSGMDSADRASDAQNKSTAAASAAASQQNALSRDQFEWQKGQAEIANNLSREQFDFSKQISSEQSKLSRDQFDWNKAIFENELLPLQKSQLALQTRVAEDSMARAARQDQLAAEQKAYYDKTFKPIEEKVAAESMAYDQDENVSRRTGIAAANVNQQVSNARAQGARLAGRYGLGSTAFSGPAGATERAQALGTAGAATGAAFDTLDKAIQLRAGVTNLGRNMPNTALNAWSGANASSGVAGNAANAGLNAAYSGANFMNNAYNNRSAGVINEANLLNSSYGNRMNGVLNESNMINNAYGSRIGTIGSSTGLLMNSYNNQANMWNNAAAGWGSLAGGLFQKSGGFNGSFGSFGGLGTLGGLGTALTYGTNLGSQQTSMLAAQEAGMF